MLIQAQDPNGKETQFWHSNIRTSIVIWVLILGVVWGSKIRTWNLPWGLPYLGGNDRQGGISSVVGQLSFLELSSGYLPRAGLGYAVYEFNPLRELEISQALAAKVG